MSEATVPLWKQEFLKRRERNVKLGKKHDKPPRNSDLLSHAKMTTPNCRLNCETETKMDFSFSRHREQKVSEFSEHASSESAGFIVLDDDAVGLQNDTRRPSTDKKGSRLSSPQVNSRLHRSNESSRGENRRTVKYDRNGEIHGTTNREAMQSISRLDREYCGNNVNSFSSITLDDTEKERLKSFVGIDQRVDSEHIRPKDVKRMWKTQESKEELPLESRNSQPKPSSRNNVVRASFAEVKSQVSSQGGNFSGDNQRVNSSVGASNVPKAYKSPFAKKQWNRQSVASNSKPGEKKPDPEPLQRNGYANVKQGTSNRNGFHGNDTSDDKVENDHIPSVKSLLGLFGGKGSGSVGCKHHETPQVSKAAGKKPLSPMSNSFVPVPPNLTRHHSEPNLYSPPKEDKSVQLHDAKIGLSRNDSSLQSSEALVDRPIAFPSHHVSHGIKERMTLLRRASHSSMEDLKVAVEDDCGETVNAAAVITKEETVERKLSDSDYRIETNEIIPKKSSTNKMKEEPVINVSDYIKDKLHSGKNSSTQLTVGEKSTPSTYANCGKAGDEVCSKTNTSELLNVDHHGSKHTVDENEEKRIPEQSFDKLLSVFGPRAGKKSSLAVTDKKESKSLDKYLDKQSNYIVEDGQSAADLGDQLASTGYSKRIMENQQESGKVIKKEVSDKGEKKLEKKRRRSLLNVVDPLEVLQLTKDPILLKGKPVFPDSGLIKESETGRKPSVEIIKSQPDKKAQIAQINRAWDLNLVQPTGPERPVNGHTMPSSSFQQSSAVSPQKKNIPVSSIDDIPVSSVDEVPLSETQTSIQEISTNNEDGESKDTQEIKLGNATFYTGTLTSELVDHEGESEEFIPVSSIDDDSSLLLPPEIVFEKDPEKVKSCLANKQIEKKATVSFFQHVFIHDYQSENAATADWDYENGQAFGSYTPAAVRQYTEIDIPAKHDAPPVSTVDQPNPVDEPQNDEPTITYNENESMGFTESSDSTAGALLF